MKQVILAFLYALIPFIASADESYTSTNCASKVFANGLAETASAISESDSEEIIQQWIYRVFSDQNVLADVLKCPEIAEIADNETIKFTPIQYTFPGGREIVVNYETQPRILKQRLTIGDKRDLSTVEPNPRVGADDAIWTNVDPAWYAIMVVEHGALDNFVGPDKNNTISLDYINDNIDDLFPKNHGGTCTGKSALTRDSTEINHVMREMTVDIENDTNDYYVAGDVNLQWISYAEIALDVALTVATFGGSQVITGATKSARAARILNNMRPALKSLRQIPSVQDYVRLANQLDNANDALKNLDSPIKSSTALSFKSIWSISMSMPLEALTFFTASLSTVSVRRPKKSILRRPSSSN